MQVLALLLQGLDALDGRERSGLQRLRVRGCSCVCAGVRVHLHAWLYACEAAHQGWELRRQALAATSRIDMPASHRVGKGNRTCDTGPPSSFVVWLYLVARMPVDTQVRISLSKTFHQVISVQRVYDVKLG